MKTEYLEDISLSEVHSTGDFRPVESEVDARLLVEATQQAITNLPERLQIIVLGRYWSNQTLEELSRGLDVTTERVRQLQLKAETRLTDPLKEFATPDQIRRFEENEAAAETRKKTIQAEAEARRNSGREDIQDPVPNTLTERTTLKGFLMSSEMQSFIFDKLSPQSESLPSLEQFPNSFSCNQTWIKAAHQLKTWPDGHVQYFFTGVDKGKWFMVGSLMRQNKPTDFESSRQSWNTETEKFGMFPVFGKISTEPTLSTSAPSKNKPFVSLESIYEFLTDGRELSFLLTHVGERNYWIFRTKDSVSIEGEASEDDFDQFRKYWYGVLKNTKAFTRSGIFNPNADAYSKKVGLQICNKHNLLVYEGDGDTYFHRIS